MASLPQIGLHRQDQPTEALRDWRPGTRIALRFAFAYFVLYIFPYPLGSIPYTDWPAQKYGAQWDRMILWVGKHVLHLSYSISVPVTGSGDRTYDYIGVLCGFIGRCCHGRVVAR